MSTYRLEDLFGYVLLAPDGRVLEQSHEPPSRWRPEIRALFSGPCPSCSNPPPDDVVGIGEIRDQDLT